MPLYEYLCHGCGKKFEVLQKFSDEPLSTHEECGGPAEKLISAPAFHLKGSGWYVTDYAKGGSNNTAPSKGGDAKSGESSGADAKPAETKSETKSDTSTTKTDASPAPASSTT